MLALEGIEIAWVPAQRSKQRLNEQHLGVGLVGCIGLLQFGSVCQDLLDGVC